MSELSNISVVDLISKLRSKEVSSVEIATHLIDKIRKINPEINALSQFNPEQLLKEAKIADDKSTSKQHLGRLHGIPVSIKDTCKVKGFICSKSSKLFPRQVCEQDATIIKRLKQEGALILGVTNTSELLLSYETDNEIYGRTNNPYDIRRTAGGSSGGEGALIASRCSFLGIGSDAGASIRQPASYCGIVGHKPTQGIVPLTGDIPFDGEAGIATQVYTYGPMGRYASDVKLMLDVISGPDDYDPHCYARLYEPPKTIRELKCAFFYGIKGVEPEAQTFNAVKNAISVLQKFVADVTESYPKVIEDTYKLLWETILFGGDGGVNLKKFLTSGERKIAALPQQFIDESSQFVFSSQELSARYVEIEKFRYEMMGFMYDYDILISPATPTIAPLHGQANPDRKQYAYLCAHNLTGWPATVIPIGLSSEGLPIGLQIAAKPGRDYLCLAVAEYLQNEIGVLPAPIIS